MLREAGIVFVETEAAFFVYVEAPPGGGMKFAKWCFDNDVAVLPGAMFSARDSHVRLSFAAAWPETREAVAAFISLYQ
jgi:aspartate/methionine/tyrosine aminotransferase